MMQPQKILVFEGEDLLGDGLLKLPFVHALRATYPLAEIHWWAGYGKTAFKTALAPLVEGFFTDIKEHAFGGLGWKNIITLKRFAHEEFDLIIDTQRDLKVTLLLKKVPHKKFLSSTHLYMLSDFKPAKRKKPKSEHLVDKLLFLLEVVGGKGIVAPFTTLPPAYKIPMQTYFSPRKTYVGISPGAGQAKKCWPLENFIQVGRELVAKNKVPVFILGPQEQSWKDMLQHVVPESLFPLQEHPEWLESPLYTAGLASYLTCAVANDSGTGHLLALGGTPLISLFGKTKAEKVHPFAKKLIILKAHDYGSMEVKDIPVKDVLKALSQL